MSPEIFGIAFQLAAKLLPKSINSIFEMALNMRLGTKGLTIPQIEVKAAEIGLSLLELMAQVEKEGWVYDDGYSYVCSSFVLGLYKRAGIFGDLELEATEFTPRDVYSLDVFDLNYQRPQICIESDPGIPYCQILGNYRINLGKDYSSITPYSHMNENCPSLAPNFVRPNEC